MVEGSRLEPGQAISSDWGGRAATGSGHDNVGEAALGGSVIATGPLRKAMREIAARKGDFTLFALLMRADSLGRWDLVVSAPWLESGKLKATSELVELLSDSIGREALQQFARVATVVGA